MDLAASAASAVFSKPAVPIAERTEFLKNLRRFILTPLSSFEEIDASLFMTNNLQ